MGSLMLLGDVDRKAFQNHQSLPRAREVRTIHGVAKSHSKSQLIAFFSTQQHRAPSSIERNSGMNHWSKLLLHNFCMIKEFFFYKYRVVFRERFKSECKLRMLIHGQTLYYLSLFHIKLNYVHCCALQIASNFDNIWCL